MYQVILNENLMNKFPNTKAFTSATNFLLSGQEYRLFINFKKNKGSISLTRENTFKDLLTEDFVTDTKLDLLRNFCLLISKIEELELRTAVIELFFAEWKCGESKID